MASLTCPNCGRDNPDFLDDCQFCQTALRRESTLNIGDEPTKKSTGELEGVLPDWLKEARQQARASAEEEAEVPPSKPRIQKEEPQDLLAGLAFQAADEDEEVPDWLTAISPVKKDEGQKPSASAKESDEAPSDFFAQFNQPAKPAEPEQAADDSQAEGLPWLSGATNEPAADDGLGDWLSQNSSQESEPLPFGQENAPDAELWGHDISATSEPEQPAPAPSEPEDLGWLRDLEASAKGPDERPAQPPAENDWLSNLDTGSGSQEDLGWLNNLGGMPAPAEPAPAKEDDLGWLNNLGGMPAPAEPASADEDLGWLNNLGGQPLASEPTPAQSDSPQEVLGWLKNFDETPASTPAQPAAPQSEDDLGWLKNFDEPAAPAQPAAPQSEDDLGWLKNFDQSAAPAESAAPQSEDDLNWLSNLGDAETPAPAEPAAEKQEELDWLSNLGGTSQPSEEAVPAQSDATSDDLGWLSNLGGESSEPAAEQPAEPSSATGLDWLDNFGDTPAAAEPAGTPTQEDDLGWLDSMGGTPASEPSEPTPTPFAADVPDWLKSAGSETPDELPRTPARTAPLSQEAAENIPDWLKSATESAAASLPPLEAAASTPDQSFDELLQGFDETPSAEPGGMSPFDQSQPEPAALDESFFPAPAESAAASDVDALFNVDMPDWLTQQPETAGDSAAEPGALPSNIDASLSPADLPSWVQAMRPVESVISEASTATEDQPTERQGPLAGFRGVIPFMPIGSSQRPKAVSLKLQASAEQQSSAALIEQIIAGEAQPRTAKTEMLVASQRTLRWTLTGLFLLVLSIVLALGSQSLPVDVSTAQMSEIQGLSSTILTLPEGAPVLVVMDYEPALAGELESAAGPMLDQMTLLRHPIYTFVSTSANGTGLVERLLRNTGISAEAGYQAEVNYFNLGYLPGGTAGVRGFVENPQMAMPTARVNLFSDFAAVIILTDHAESGLVWIEQVELAKQTDPALVNKPVLVAASAQAGPLLQPYVSSRQVTSMISGLADAARFEFMNSSRPGIARGYWDAFGAGLALAVLSIVLGSLWSLVSGMRARRANPDGG